MNIINSYTTPWRCSRNRTIVALLVLALHASLLISCNSFPPQKTGSGEAPTDNIWRYVESNDPLRAFNGTYGLACAQTYQGIGVRIQPGSQEIIEVAPGGPADIAGVHVGDFLLNEGSFYRDTGTLVLVKVKRNGKELELKAFVNKICSKQ